MKSILAGITLGLIFPMVAIGQQSIYCPQRGGYINLGMTPDQVIAACGMPVSQQESNQPVMRKIPVQQIIFNNAGASTAFYGVWAIPGGIGNYGTFQPYSGNTGGARLEIESMNNQIRNIKLNGNDVNSFTICQGMTVNTGDAINRAYSACGNPSVVNNTYINVSIESAEKPQIWIYQPGPYQPPLNLTFVNGRLQSIN